MIRQSWRPWLSLTILGILGCAGQSANQASSTSTSPSDAVDGFQRQFDVPANRFASTGKNPYFVLEPGYQLTLTGEDDGKPARLVVTVLNETKRVDGVETRIVEERESVNDRTIEVSRNFFAIDPTTNDLYYFGEDVDMYKNGQVSGHEGSWQSGKNGAHYGLFMPGTPHLGQKFYQEIAPRTAMDRCEIVNMSQKTTVPAGTFENCLKTEETTPLEPGAKEYKVYAPGVGLLIDGGLKLTKKPEAR